MYSGGHVFSPSSGSDSDYSSSSSIPLLSPDVTDPVEIVNVIRAQEHYLNSLDKTIKRPFLQIQEDTANQFRFRYLTEMQGTHGAIQGVSSTKKKKTFPTVKLCGFNEPAVIRCTLFTVDFRSFHVHRLVRKSPGKNGDPHDIPVGPSSKNGYVACFQNLVIIHTARRNFVDELVDKKRRAEEAKFPKKTLNIAPELLNKMRTEAELEKKKIDANCARLMFEALQLQNGRYVPICNPVFSSIIKNMKNHITGQLKICRRDKVSGSCEGNEEIFLLVEKVGKGNIKVVLTECNDYGEEVWNDECTFSPSDVHHQFAIVCRTPKYRNTDIRENVSVKMQLERRSDGARSEPVEFTYRPRENLSMKQPQSNKRRRVSSITIPSFGLQQKSPDQDFDVSSSTAAAECTIRNRKLFPHIHDELVNSTNEVETPPWTESEDYVQMDPDDDLMKYNAVDNIIGDDRCLSDLSSPTSILSNLPTPDITNVELPMFSSGELTRYWVTLNNANDEGTGDLVCDGMSSKMTEKADIPYFDRIYHEMMRPEHIYMPESGPILVAQHQMDLTGLPVQDVAVPESDGMPSNVPEGYQTNPKPRKIKGGAERKDQIDPQPRKIEGRREWKDQTDPQPRKIKDYLLGQIIVKRLEQLSDVLSFPSISSYALQPMVHKIIGRRTAAGNSALHTCIKYKQYKLLNTLLQYLVYFKCRDYIDCRNSQEQAPIHFTAYDDSYVEIMKRLLEFGADPNSLAKGRTPLHIAVSGNCKEIVKCLLDSRQIDIDSVSDSDGTALHIAVKNSRIELVKLLLDHGADVNSIDKKTGRTPLHIATTLKHVEILTVLFQQPNIERNKEDFSGYTPFKLLVIDESVPLRTTCEILRKQGAVIDNERNPVKKAKEQSEDELSKIIVSLFINKD